MSCFISGTKDERGSIRVKLPVAARIVSMQALIDVIEEFRLESLLTPQVCPPQFWEDADEHRPAQQAERYLQWGVAVALRNSFRPIQADIEQSTPVGRLDIYMIDTRPQAGVMHPAVIELKALRSRTSGGTAVSRRRNLMWIIAGYRQTKAYQNQKHAALGLLACFDLRISKDDLLGDTLVRAAHARYFDTSTEACVFKVYGSAAAAQEEMALRTKPAK